jgi:hypothetical protein
VTWLLWARFVFLFMLLAAVAGLAWIGFEYER